MQAVIKNPWLLFFGVAVGPLMAGIDFLAIAVAVEPMAKSLAIDIATLQWFLTAFAIGNASFLVTSGRLADLHGRRTVYISGLLIFILSSAVIAVSHTPWVIIVSRLIQGASTGIMSTTAVAILTSLYEPEKRAGWMSAVMGATGLGMVLGPSVGGYLIHHFSWQMVFIINIPIGLVGLLFTWFYVPKQLPQMNGQKLDWWGIALFTITLVLFTVGVSQGHYWGWGSITTVTMFVLTIIMLFVFIYAELRCSHPLIQFPLFKITNFLAANIVGFIAYFAMTAWILVFGIYLQRVMKLSPQDAGISLLPFGIMIVMLAPVMGKISHYLGIKKLMVLGNGVAIIAFAGMSLITVQVSYWLLAVWFALYGCSFMFVNACSITAALQFMPDEKTGIGSGASLMMRWLGGAVGAAVIATVFMVSAANKMQKMALQAKFQDATLSLMQAYHSGLVISMMVLTGLAVLALLVSQLGIKKKAI